MHMAIRHADGSVEAWPELQYRPPLRMVVGVEILAQARSWRAGDDSVPQPVVFVVREVYSGPPAHLPNPSTACEFNRAMDEEWLLREWELTK